MSADFLFPMGGPTKQAEYRRTIEVLDEIIEANAHNSRIFYLLAFLYDSGYNNQDLKKMMDLCHPKVSKK
jgi:hypothetical protein